LTKKHAPWKGRQKREGGRSPVRQGNGLRGEVMSAITILVSSKKGRGGIHVKREGTTRDGAKGRCDSLAALIDVEGAVVLSKWKKVGGEERGKQVVQGILSKKPQTLSQSTGKTATRSQYNSDSKKKHRRNQRNRIERPRSYVFPSI